MRALGLVALALVACGTPSPTSATTRARRHLDPSIVGWLPQNRARIDRLLDMPIDPTHRPVAVFDWDNTMMRNDIGDATLFWMLRHDEVLQPPDRDWSRTNVHMTPAARKALGAACDALAEPGHPLTTSRSRACADALLSVYDGQLPDGAPAFDDETTATMKQSYAWGVQIQAGHTPDEIRAFAESAYAENANAPIGAKQTVGSRTDLDAWVRIYDPMRDLVGALQTNGFDVWIVSASAQPVVEVVASKVGVDAKHAIGVRAMLRKDDKLDHRLRGCGTEPDGADSVITYDRGKRCWINREIFHLPTNEQLERARDPKMRPVFAAGDADTDLAMVQDATVLKLAINRNKPRLMCNAYNDAGGRWLVQPMFIEPLPQRKLPYACSAMLDEDGHAMTDREDTIFALP